jgi:glutamyl-tRNA synthetase
MNVITRIAPSPTGNLHIGTARTALFNFLFARKENGVFIARIEDTDRERSKKEYEIDILEGLSWLGLVPDAIYRQSERGNLYRQAIDKLLATDAAYVSKEQSRENPEREVEVIRLRNKKQVVSFKDRIRGEVRMNTEDLGDFVIARSIDEPLYHLAVVVDDADMNVTHVIRGEDHISNTPRQILIGEALGLERPVYAHIPLILAPDRSKLSKRSGATSIREYREKGYLPDALNNYLALLGWSPGTDQEMFTLDELVNIFSIDDIQHSGAIFDIEKLNWFNTAYLRKLPGKVLLAKIEAYLPGDIMEQPTYTKERLQKIVPVIAERISHFDEVRELAEAGEFDYYFKEPDYPGTLLIPRQKSEPVENTAVAKHLMYLERELREIPENNFNADEVKRRAWDYANEQGRAAVLWPLRVALSGQERSPDPFSLAEILGKEITLRRLMTAQKKVAHVAH